MKSPKGPTVPDRWPFVCEVCGGWCRPATEVIATTDPIERSGLVIEAHQHSLGKRAAGYQKG